MMKVKMMIRDDEDDDKQFLYSYKNGSNVCIRSLLTLCG